MQAHLNDTITAIYRRRAKRYDLTANLYYLFGYREWTYRRMTVDALQLQPGATVVEVGCGTGLNFPIYQEAIGPRGKIVGVDLTDAMLAQAQQRVDDHNWHNVDLVQADARNFSFPREADAVVSTYALSLIPEAPLVLERAAAALAPGGRLALLELQPPQNWPGWLVDAAVWLMKPFAVTAEWQARRPWEAIKQTMSQELTDVSTTETYLGLTYIIAGTKA